MAAIPFVDQETEFRDWRRNNPSGYILNTTRRGSANYLKLHAATCWTISGEPRQGKYWTKDYSKVCAPDRQEIDKWVDQQFGTVPRPCPFCLEH